jgi:SNF2 family DNA or RNA helicase
VKEAVVHDSSLELIHSLHYLSISPSLLTPYIDYTDSSKLMKMVEIMEDFRNENKSTIVFCQFRKEIELAKTVLVDCGVCEKKNVFVLDGSFSSVEREKVLVDMKQRVEDGEFVVLLLQLKSGACGLNLQYFGAVVFINKWWNQPIIDQAIGRVVRIGSTGVKDIVFLVGERGYDVLVNNVLQRKLMASGGI